MIFVTGASGNVGAAVVELLRERRIPHRIGARQPERIAPQPDREVVRFDFNDPSTFRDAVRGCNAVFLLRPPAIANMRKTLNPFVDIARAEGVEQIVFVSVAGAGDNPLVPHHAVEQHLHQGSNDWTILRSGFFAQNLGDAYRDDLKFDERLFVPAGTGRVAFIDTRDLAEVAVNVMLAPAGHQGKTYRLTGAEALSFAEVAGILSARLGRKIQYQPASILGYFTHLLHRQLPIDRAFVQTILHVGLRFGQAEVVDDTLSKLLGHPCRSLEDYVRDYCQLWLKTA